MVIVMPSIGLILCVFIFLFIDYTYPRWSIEQKLFVAFGVFSVGFIGLAIFAESLVHAVR